MYVYTYTYTYTYTCIDRKVYLYDMRLNERNFIGRVTLPFKHCNSDPTVSTAEAVAKERCAPSWVF